MTLGEDLRAVRKRLEETGDPEELATLNLRGAVLLRAGGDAAHRAGDDPRQVREFYETGAWMTRRSAELVCDHQSLAPGNEAWKNVPLMLRDADAQAVVARDDRERRAAAEDALGLPAAYVETFPDRAGLYHEVRTYAAVAVDDPDAETHRRRTASALAAREGAEGAGDPGVWSVLTGILDDDPASVAEGLHRNLLSLRDRFPGNEQLLFAVTLGTAALAAEHGYADALPRSDRLPGALLPTGES